MRRSYLSPEAKAAIIRNRRMLGVKAPDLARGLELPTIRGEGGRPGYTQPPKGRDDGDEQP
ncbi:hypothetical protein [Nitrospirillum bahiense]|uniref:Uncharacterized protein n=1 Tax=Nitrospirillum amazonense TaxID=28077 RepID=A0A560F1X9_9PROT|nr:hypothetical protein [Nitrospirillum amazonense]TWB15629.1 hypothetical protein FBZ88_12982 [Nitrospirillum amazonense]